MSTGMIHIYTGSGKGKTTAALGLCFRAAGYGYRCAFLQFLKGRDTGEKYSCAKIDPAIVFEQYGSKEFVFPENAVSVEDQRLMAVKGIKRAREIIVSGDFDVVVLDEIVTLPSLKICAENEIIQLAELERGRTELILTGRGAWDDLLSAADLVTEMKEAKHYFKAGVSARKGIEY